MNRRRFVSGLASVPAMGAVVRAAPSAVATASTRVQAAPSARMVVGTQQKPTSDALLQFCKRHACDHICGYPETSGSHRCATFDALRRLKDKVESHGISLDLVPLPLSSSYITRSENPSIMMGKSPERDRAIDAICAMIRDVARAGIPAVKYNLTVLGVLRTSPTPGRGGSRYSTWDLSLARQDPPLTEAGPCPADVMWERITYFLERVVPVAEEFKVKLACHPHDPGVPASGFRGVDRVLGTVEGLKKFVSIRESPYHGLNFCQGTVSEMLEDPASEIVDVIRYFGSRGKIFNVHFRNIRGRRDRFQEVYPDEGDVDFVRCIRAYKEVGYTGMLMPDHVPHHPDDPNGLQAFAFAFGHTQALIQAVYASG